jgi:flagellar FliL protein
MSLLKNLAASSLLVVFLLSAGTANAEEGGGNAGKFATVGAIVANLSGSTPRYIQIEMTLKLSNPELSEKVKTYMPVIRNNLILLFSSKNAEQLAPTEAKQKLIEESKVAINKAMGLAEKEGVTEVFFSSFIIQ